MNLKTRMKSFLRDETGQDLLEYALLTALIALAATAAIKAAGVQVGTIFENIKDQLSTAS